MFTKQTPYLLVFSLTLITITLQSFTSINTKLKNSSYDTIIPVQSQQIKLTGKIISGNIIALNYQTLEGNNPYRNKNWVAIWQGSQIHYHEKPLAKKLIKNTTQDGSIAFDSLQLSNLKYTVGFGSNNKTTNSASFLFFPKNSYVGIPFSSSINLIDHSDNYVVAHFKTPLGNTPLINKNWIAIWLGKTIKNNCMSFLAKEYIKTNTASDNVIINNITLVRQNWYTIAYGTGSNCSSIVATYSFFNN